MRAPDLHGAPQTTVNSHGSFILANGTLGKVRLVAERSGYATLDTNISVPSVPAVLPLVPNYLVGDCNRDGTPDVLDVVRLIDFVFAGSANGPIPYWSGDVDFNRVYDVFDVVGLIDYVFAGAAAPHAPTCYP